MRFGISTHLFHGERLARRHLERLAANELTLVEIFATRTHVDYHDAASVAQLGGWLRELEMTAWSVHLPIFDGFADEQWGRPYSNASPDPALRQEAVAEAVMAIAAARDLGCQTAVLHLGVPHGQLTAGGDNEAGAARRSLESIAEACQRAELRLAIELIPNDLSTADALTGWLEGELELGPAGVCLDVGHAHLLGGAAETIERLSGHVVTTHVHDNRGRSDDHLAPFDGTVDWPSVLMTLSKVGYTGPLVFEVAAQGDAERALNRTVAARRRIQAILDDLAQPFDFIEG